MTRFLLFALALDCVRAGAMPPISVLPMAPPVVNCNRTTASYPRGIASTAAGSDATKPFQFVEKATLVNDKQNHDHLKDRDADVTRRLEEAEAEGGTEMDFVQIGAGIHGAAVVSELTTLIPDARGIVLDSGDRGSAQVFSQVDPGKAGGKSASANTFHVDPNQPLFRNTALTTRAMAGVKGAEVAETSTVGRLSRQSLVESNVDSLFNAGVRIVPSALYGEYFKGKIPANMREKAEKNEYLIVVTRGGKKYHVWTNVLPMATGMGTPRIIGNSPAEQAIYKKHLAAAKENVDGPIPMREVWQIMGATPERLQRLAKENRVTIEIEGEPAIEANGYVGIGAGYSQLVASEMLTAEAVKLPGRAQNVLLQGGPLPSGDSMMKLLGLRRKKGSENKKEVNQEDYEDALEALNAEDKAAALAYRANNRLIVNARNHSFAETGDPMRMKVDLGPGAMDLVKYYQLVKSGKSPAEAKRLATVKGKVTGPMVVAAGYESTPLQAGGLFGPQYVPVFVDRESNVRASFGPFANGKVSTTHRAVDALVEVELDENGVAKRDRRGNYTYVLDANGKPRLIPLGAEFASKPAAFGPSTHTGVLGVFDIDAEKYTHSRQPGLVNWKLERMRAMETDAEGSGIPRNEATNALEIALKEAVDTHGIWVNGQLVADPTKVAALNRFFGRVLDRLYSESLARIRGDARKLTNEFAAELINDALDKDAPGYDAELAAIIKGEGRNVVIRTALPQIVQKLIDAVRMPANDSPDSLLRTIPRTFGGAGLLAADLLQYRARHPLPPRTNLAGETLKARQQGGTSRLQVPPIMAPSHAEVAEQRPEYFRLDVSSRADGNNASVHPTALLAQLKTGVLSMLFDKVKLPATGGNRGHAVVHFRLVPETNATDKDARDRIDLEIEGLDRESANKLRDALFPKDESFANKSPDEIKKIKAQRSHFLHTLYATLRQQGGALTYDIAFVPDGRLDAFRTGHRVPHAPIAKRVTEDLNQYRRAAAAHTGNGQKPDLRLVPTSAQTIFIGSLPLWHRDATDPNFIREVLGLAADVPVELGKVAVRAETGHRFRPVTVGTGPNAVTYVINAFPDRNLSDTVDRGTGQVRPRSFDKATNYFVTIANPRLAQFFPELVRAGKVHGDGTVTLGRNTENPILLTKALPGKKITTLLPENKQKLTAAKAEELAASLRVAAKTLAALWNVRDVFERSQRYTDFVEAQMKMGRSVVGADVALLNALTDPLFARGTAHGNFSFEHVFVDGGKARFSAPFRTPEGAHPMDDVGNAYRHLYATLERTDAHAAAEVFKEALRKELKDKITWSLKPEFDSLFAPGRYVPEVNPLAPVLAAPAP